MHLTPGELSARWHGVIKPHTLAVWRNKRKGPPFVKFGRRVLYPASLLEEWEKRQLVQTTG
ncbi:DNA-binding protein [Rhodanobacter sp. L36]|uniref:DNA-binding protein n=1 Tax=Rhodanobacter sp. L36 TaxID=1747221 RepID=UPI00131BB079|nr:DNA-binding protein [Rhodanobacter sp. L36]